MEVHIAEEVATLMSVNGETTGSDLYKVSQINIAQSEHHTTETVRVSEGYSAKHRRNEKLRLYLVVNNKRIVV